MKNIYTKEEVEGIRVALLAGVAAQLEARVLRKKLEHARKALRVFDELTDEISDIFTDEVYDIMEE